MNDKHPNIKDAKDLAYKYRKSGVIILHFDDGVFGTASYGMTRQKCDEMRGISEMIFDLIGSKTPVEIIHES